MRFVEAENGQSFKNPGKRTRDVPVPVLPPGANCE